MEEQLPNNKTDRVTVKRIPYDLEVDLRDYRYLVTQRYGQVTELLGQIYNGG